MFKTLRTALFGMGAFLLAGGLLTVPAQASDYPSKPIQLVSPYGAGGDSDLCGLNSPKRNWGSPWLW